MKFIKLGKIGAFGEGIIEYGIESKRIIWVTIYKGNKSFYKTIWDKNWKWVVKYAKKQDWEYEQFKYFKDARLRALEIAWEKSG